MTGGSALRVIVLCATASSCNAPQKNMDDTAARHRSAASAPASLVRPDSIPGLENAGYNSVAFSDWSRTRGAPRFEEFRVADTAFASAPAPPNLASMPGAARFRSVLREGATAGPNFAGRYTIVDWGCGSPCVQVVIMDAASGRILYWSDPAWVSRPVFTRWSRLLANDPTWIMTNDRGQPEYATTVQYFEWTGRRLELRDTLDAAHARIRN